MNEKLDPATPVGWGNDSLTQFLDVYRRNQLATFASKRSEVVDLATIDGLFRKLLDGAINPRPLLPIGFLLRAHAAFLAASGAVMAGQLFEVQALLRVCLEQGGYAHFIGDDQQRWERWMARHDSAEAKKIIRSEFQHSKICEHVRAADSALGDIYSELYERTIDYGAHPNERGASLSSSIEDTEEGGKRFGSVYLHGSGLMLDFSLKTTAQIGICVLRIAQSIYPARMQATGVQYQLETICKRF